MDGGLDCPENRRYAGKVWHWIAAGAVPEEREGWRLMAVFGPSVILTGYDAPFWMFSKND
ncbi:MAG: hypothetical protein E7K14_05040 [Bacillota bacterium]|nr:hypothetical protein [Bacillota bacterium]